MSAISSWVLSIAGVVCISVIVEIIMPDGQMNKYIKSVLSFIIIFVIVSPLPNLLKMKSEGNIEQEVSQIQVQQNFLDKYSIIKKDMYEKEIGDIIRNCGYDGVTVELEIATDEETCYFNRIYVDLRDLVILENAQHKNILEIKEEILGEVLKEFKDMEVCFEE